jgi:hypothetical protein
MTPLRPNENHGISKNSSDNHREKFFQHLVNTIKNILVARITEKSFSSTLKLGHPFSGFHDVTGASS